MNLFLIHKFYVYLFFNLMKRNTYLTIFIQKTIGIILMERTSGVLWVGIIMLFKMLLLYH